MEVSSSEAQQKSSSRFPSTPSGSEANGRSSDERPCSEVEQLSIRMSNIEQTMKQLLHELAETRRKSREFEIGVSKYVGELTGELEQIQAVLKISRPFPYSDEHRQGRTAAGDHRTSESDPPSGDDKTGGTKEPREKSPTKTCADTNEESSKNGEPQPSSQTEKKDSPELETDLITSELLLSLSSSPGAMRGQRVGTHGNVIAPLQSVGFRQGYNATAYPSVMGIPYPRFLQGESRQYAQGYIPIPSSLPHHMMRNSNSVIRPAVDVLGKRKREEYTPVARPEESNKRRRGKLPQSARDCLMQWLLAHRTRPYPSEEEKAKLVEMTGLTPIQINNWFSNARRRILRRSKEVKSGKGRPIVYTSDIKPEDEVTDRDSNEGDEVRTSSEKAAIFEGHGSSESSDESEEYEQDIETMQIDESTEIADTQ